MEIERKFSLKRLPENLEQYECKVIEQGYLCTDPIVRIRRSNDKYILTYKSKFGVNQTQSNVIVNNEIEMPLNKEGYEHLKQKVDSKIIEKRRYIIPLEGGLKIELDIFEGHLKGLCFAEIEFKSEKEAEEFQLLDWFEADVSNDKRYRNNYLAELNSVEEFYEAKI